MKNNNTKKRWLATAIASALCCVSAVATMSTTHADDTTQASTKSKTSHEVVDYTSTRYFSTPDGVIFEFCEIYDVEDGEVLESWMRGREYSKGIYAKVYEGENEPFYVQKYETLDTWDSDGTFTFNGEEYNYSLVPASMLRLEHRTLLEGIIVHKYALNPQRMAYFDYSKDGKIMVNDLVLLNKRLAATPMSSVTNCDAVMYDQMDKDTFYGIVDHALRHGAKELYVYYGDTVPQEATTTTTATVTTTLSTEPSITWNTGIAKGISGKDVTWYEVESKLDENDKRTYMYPSVVTGDKSSDAREANATDINDCIVPLTSIPFRMGANPESFKLVVSSEPIAYSWIKTKFTNGIVDEVYQICPISDISSFEYIFADKMDIGDGIMVFNSDNMPENFIWCPGSWISYHPWKNNDIDTTENDGYLYDLVVDPTDKMEDIYKLSDDCYVSLIPVGNDVSWSIGNGCTSPKKVAN